MTTTIGSLDLTSANSLYNDATQYFWFESDSTATYGAGVHITLSPSATFMSNPTGQNILINTDGISIRNGLLPMMTLGNDSLDFNLITNLSQGTYVNVATFGTTGATIGQLGGAHSVIDANGQRFYANDGTTLLANIGYGEGTATSGTADNPYYSLGTRTANSKIGNWSTSEGVNNTVAGYASHGEGADNVEYGRYNHIEGHNNRLRELYGYNLGGYAKCSHVEGENCEASGTYDGNATGVHVQNIGTIAKGDAQTAIGRYNSPDNGTDGTSTGRWGTYAFYIGNGTSDNARSNALTVEWSGNVNIASGAKYKINGTNLSASDVGAVPTSRTVNSKALSSNITLTASDVSAVSTSDKYTRSSAGDLQWTNQTDGDAKVMAKSGVAFWNGAYNGTSSNLKYSVNGEILGKTNVKDYVTATGSDGIWKYRKWSSGRIECWGEKSWSNVACTTSAGGGYRSGDVTQSLPSGLFTAIDVCQATMEGSGGSGYTMALRTLCTPTAISQMFWNTSKATKSTCIVDYYIIGT